MASTEGSLLGQQESFLDITLMTFSMLLQRKARMTASNRHDLGKTLKQHRLMIPLAMRELAAPVVKNRRSLG